MIRGDHGIASTLRRHWWSTHATDHVRRQLVSNSDFRHGLLTRLTHQMVVIDPFAD